MNLFIPTAFSRVVCVVALSLLSLLLIGASPASAQPLSLFDDVSRPGLPGRLFVPNQAETSARPLVLFLHGAGATGSNNTSQINGNMGGLFAEAQSEGAFIYAPQATTFQWSSEDRTDLVMSTIDEIIATENVDPTRIYVTGLSMGGGGTWNMANRFPDRFAAALPIAAVSPASDFDAANFLDLPTWAFHGRSDITVSVEATRSVVSDIILEAGDVVPEFPEERGADLIYASDSIDLQYSEWRASGHTIWFRVYQDTPEVYDWMFARSIPEPAAGLMLIIAALSGFGIYRRRYR